MASDWNEGPCALCGEPVGPLSYGGPDICAACDCGVCRYCRQKWGFIVYRAEADGGRSIRQLRRHIATCRRDRRPSLPLTEQERRIGELVRKTLAEPVEPRPPLDRAHGLLALWMWECKLQGWMLDNQQVEEMLQATERELGYRHD